MNSSHLKYFYDCCRLKSVAKAATENNVANSTISQAMRALENELGYALTMRTKGQLEITAEGYMLASYLKNIIPQLDALKRLKNNGEDRIAGKIRLGTHQSILSHYLWKTVWDFEKKFPDIALTITTDGKAQLFQDLVNNQVDLMIGLDHQESPNQFKSIFLREGYYRLVGSSKLESIKNCTIICANKNSMESRHLIKSIGDKNKIVQLPSWTSIYKVIRSENALGYLPDYILESDLEKGKIKEFGKALRYPYQLKAWSKFEIDAAPIIHLFLNAIAKN
jgi:DNA-binding transcriptional LysR family regulator